MRSALFLLTGCVVWLTGCGHRSTRFDLLSPSQTGVDFTNTITETDSFNVLEFEYIYNGGGVGVGDFNGDGLTDVFFAGNQVSSRMYLNRTTPSGGDFRFEDVTEAAGVGTKVWCSGVAVGDINQDGRLDVFVSTLHPDKRKAVPKLLFLNQGNDASGVPRFVEAAREVGLADSSFGTQAAFVDYDRDGDLDVYLLTNALEEYNRNTVTGPRNNGTARSVDKLYRNDGVGQGAGGKGLGAGGNERINPPPPASHPLPHFTDVSQEAGIIHEGWGLGVIVNDVNQDGWPDIYVANDFQSNDVLYINDQHGHFVNRIADALKHQSHNSMGVDMADINNDGLNDITVVDMMPDDNLRQKTMFGTVPYDKFQMAQRLGYQPQYVRNMLQLNRGFAPEGEGLGAGGRGLGAGGSAVPLAPRPSPPAPRPTPLFSDIGYMAGVYATDWSWSPLLADFDNDGYRDLLITNGYRRDVTDLDFSTYNREANQFGSDDDRHRRILESLKTLEGVHKPNVMYRNNGRGHDAGSTGLMFTNVAEDWGLDQPSYTNGTAYADFDNDGDLDLVMNNVNDPAFIYRNNTIRGQPSADNAFLRLRLKGTPGNLNGLGATVSIYVHGQMQYAEQVVQRGYQSTVEPLMHFGLGKARRIDSLKIRWPDGREQVLTNVAVNQVLTLDQAQARPQGALFMRRQEPASEPLFREVSTAVGLAFRHEETDFVDYKMQQTLLPHKHSQIGPGLAVGDVTGDGLDDVYIAGAAQQPGALFIQQPGGTFRRTAMPTKDEEETGVLFFDADNDGDQDLYAVRGSTEFGKNQAQYQDQLYLNDGKGHLTPAVNALPPTTASGSCVTAGDFDRDGDLDLFIGGRVVPQSYPKPARSYLLRNDSELTSPRPNGYPSPFEGEGKGVKFTDVTQQLAPGLAEAGLVCAALWSDYDNDGWLDLLVTGEWMPVMVFTNRLGHGTKGAAHKPDGREPAFVLRPTPLAPAGWWNSLVAGDFDNDGDTDYVAGNLGLNARYRASETEPVSVYAADYDQNGSLDPIITWFNQGNEYAAHPRETLTDQMPAFRKQFTSYAAYGKKPFAEMIPDEQRTKALVRRATYFASAFFENKGAGTFSVRPLPTEAQLSPVFGMAATDVNEDGNLDLLLVGNDYAADILTGWNDAGIGVYLQGDGRGYFRSVPVGQSGFLVDKDAKALAELTRPSGQPLFLATQNQDSLRVFAPARPLRSQTIRLQPTDQYVLATLPNGKKQRMEGYWGASYLAQSSRTVRVPVGALTAEVVGLKGRRTVRLAGGEVARK